MSGDRPTWARRMANERRVRQWSQSEAVRAMQANAAAGEKLPDAASLLRHWKRWEAGEVTPGEFYPPIIARTFRTVAGQRGRPRRDSGLGARDTRLDQPHQR